MTATQLKNETAPRQASFDDYDWSVLRQHCEERLRAYGERHGGEIEELPLEPGDQFHIALRGVRFPDGVGSGTVSASAYLYRGQLHLKLQLSHNRIFKGYEKHPDRGMVFLNNYLFLRPYSASRPPVPAEIDYALRGIETARVALETKKEARRKKGVTLLFLRDTEVAVRPGT